MPKLWNETIDAHRLAVREAILDATGHLVAEQGLTAVTMSQIAERAGIGRATLYKYFGDTEAVLLAWHERHLTAHLAQLTELARQPGTAAQRLEAVLTGFAFLSHHRQQHGAELSALLHRGEHVTSVQQQLAGLIRDLLAEVAAEGGGLRGDVAPGELATFCLHALTAAASLRSKAAVHRLVQVTLDGLRPPA